MSMGTSTVQSTLHYINLSVLLTTNKFVGSFAETSTVHLTLMIVSGIETFAIHLFCTATQLVEG